MKLFKLNTLRRLKQDEEGVTVVEYGIALAVALGIAGAYYTNLSGGIAGALNQAATIMPGTAVADPSADPVVDPNAGT